MSQAFSVALSFVLMVLVAGLPAMAHADDVIIRVGPGNKDFPLALPKVHAPGGDSQGSGQKLYDVVKRDLDMTGYFDIKDPASYVERNKGVEIGEFDFKDWELIKVAGLAKMRVTFADGGMVADVFVYDVNAQKKVVAKRYRGTTAQTRYLGHKIADTILLALTGEKGFFGSRLTAVGQRAGNKEIYVMDIDGHGVRPVTRNGSINLSPAWSPDGGSIVWTSYKRDNPDLYIKSLSTGRTRVISNRQGINTGAAYSPDGSRIALTRSANGDSDVYIVDAKTGADLKRVTTGGGIDVSPSWAPDGRRLVFSSERSGGSQVFVYDVGSGSTERVSRFGSFNFDPVWSPDGKTVAYVTQDGNFDIIATDMETGRTTRLTQAQGDNEDPSWSPDGRYLLFSSTRRGKSEIWLSTADGKHQVPVTTGSGGWSQPSWGP